MQQANVTRSKVSCHDLEETAMTLPYWYGTHLWHVAMLADYALSLINPSTPTVPVPRVLLRVR